MSEAFWETLRLDQMTTRQWESLCDGCGKCCLHKLEDEETGELHFTTVACEYLDLEHCRCRVYEQRKNFVPECLKLEPKALEDVNYLPATCAYRLLAEGKSLPEWHPLISGERDSVHQAQVSVRDKAISEVDVAEDDFDLYIIDSL